MTHRTKPLAVRAEQYMGEGFPLTGMVKRDITDSNNYTSKKWCIWSPSLQRYLPVSKGDWVVKSKPESSTIELVFVFSDVTFQLLYEELPPEGVS